MKLDDLSGREQLWLDEPIAEEQIASASVPDSTKAVARELIANGLAVIRAAHQPALCRAVIDDYQRYVDGRRSYVDQNLDALGREKRLVNFHLWSEYAARIGTAPRVMEVLDFLFDMEAAVYTSLTFKYGTQQPVHRDTPHFATWPRKMFFGVWTALEPIAAAAGPLFYHPGAHRLGLDPQEYMAEAVRRAPDGALADRLFTALDLYNGAVIRQAPEISAPKVLELGVGDTVIWHPDLPHGGSAARDPERTRWSIVFHCSPVAVQVHQHDRFSTHFDDAAPPDRYGYSIFNGRKVAASGETAYM